MPEPELLSKPTGCQNVARVMSESRKLGLKVTHRCKVSRGSVAGNRPSRSIAALCIRVKKSPSALQARAAGWCESEIFLRPRLVAVQPFQLRFRLTSKVRANTLDNLTPSETSTFFQCMTT